MITPRVYLSRETPIPKWEIDEVSYVPDQAVRKIVDATARRLPVELLLLIFEMMVRDEGATYHLPHDDGTFCWEIDAALERIFYNLLQIHSESLRPLARRAFLSTATFKHYDLTTKLNPAVNPFTRLLTISGVLCDPPKLNYGKHVLRFHFDLVDFRPSSEFDGGDVIPQSSLNAFKIIFSNLRTLHIDVKPWRFLFLYAGRFTGFGQSDHAAHSLHTQTRIVKALVQLTEIKAAKQINIDFYALTPKNNNPLISITFKPGDVLDPDFFTPHVEAICTE